MKQSRKAGMASKATVKKKPAVWKPKIEVRNALVDNPYFSRAHDGEDANPLKIRAEINIRESAITTMAARGNIAEHQVAAAVKFRKLWEDLGGVGARAFDYSREPVDGGIRTDPISTRQMEAGKQLKACRDILGARPYDIVCKVAGEGFAITELVKTHRERTTMADYLKHALDDLAEHWGFKTVKNTKVSPRPRVASL